MRFPIQITAGLRLIAPDGGAVLTGSQAIRLGGDLLRRGALAVAEEAMGDQEAPQRRFSTRRPRAGRIGR
jgi:hypothetical protein